MALQRENYKLLIHIWLVIQEPFAKFMDSPYYSKFELCGGGVTVSLRSTSLGKQCTSYNTPSTSPKRAADH